jgi:hypothetical protein
MRCLIPGEGVRWTLDSNKLRLNLRRKSDLPKRKDLWLNFLGRNFFFSTNKVVRNNLRDFLKAKAVFFRCFKKPLRKYLNLVLTRRRLLTTISRNLIKINFLL